MTEKTDLTRVNFYIDGFNFYFGLKRMCEHRPDWRKFYWMDFTVFCEQFLKKDETIGVVRYFTSRPKTTGKMIRQNTLMNMNTALHPDKFERIYGRYANNEIFCNAMGGCKRPFDDPEEKETDVNLAITMVIDAYENNCDKMVLVSADTDFVPPLKEIKNNHKHIETMVLFPPATKHSSHLTQICKNRRDLSTLKSKWNKAVLAYEVEAGGRTHVIPESWKPTK